MVLKRQWFLIFTGLCWLVPARFVARGYRFYLAMGALISVLIIQIDLLMPYVAVNLGVVKEPSLVHDIVAIAVSLSSLAVMIGITILPAVWALLIVFNEKAAGPPVNSMGQDY